MSKRAHEEAYIATMRALDVARVTDDVWRALLELLTVDCGVLALLCRATRAFMRERVAWPATLERWARAQSLSLACARFHPRDACIFFDEPIHRYTLLRWRPGARVLLCQRSFAPTPAEVALALSPLARHLARGARPLARLVSMTTWIATLFERFDEDKAIAVSRASRGYREGHKYWGMSDAAIKAQWQAIRDRASVLGTAMHLEIELRYNARHLAHAPHAPPEQTRLCAAQAAQEAALAETRAREAYAGERERAQFDAYEAGWVAPQGLVAWRAEANLWDAELLLCGQVDMLYVYAADPEPGPGARRRVVMVDWKRSEKHPTEGFRGQCGVAPLTQAMPDCKASTRALQLAGYALLLRRNYAIDVVRHAVVLFHPDLPTYAVHDVPVDLALEARFAAYRMTQLSVH